MKNAIATAARHAHRRLIAGQEEPMDMAIIEARAVQKYGAPVERVVPTAPRTHFDLPIAAGMWCADARDLAR